MKQVYESRCLLNGKLYCAHCGYRLHVATGKYFVEENGIKLRELRYICYGRSRKRTECDGQSTYAAKWVDEAVDSVIRYIFDSMRNIPKNEVINSGLTALKQEKESIYKTVQR